MANPRRKRALPQSSSPTIPLVFQTAMLYHGVSFSDFGPLDIPLSGSLLDMAKYARMGAVDQKFLAVREHAREDSMRHGLCVLILRAPGHRDAVFVFRDGILITAPNSSYTTHGTSAECPTVHAGIAKTCPGHTHYN
jgi:hypothetical protein